MIEIHHAPFTLFSIVDIVMRKHEDLYREIDEFKVAEEVMRLHYNGLVGLVPLSITCHQLVHDDQLIVPLWCVYGRFVEFTKKYYEWIPDEILSALADGFNIVIETVFKPYSFAFLRAVKYVYLDTDGERNMEEGIDISVEAKVA